LAPRAALLVDAGDAGPRQGPRSTRLVTVILPMARAGAEQGPCRAPSLDADGPTLSATPRSQGIKSSQHIRSFCPRFVHIRGYPQQYPPREQRIDLLNGPSRGSLCLAKAPLSHAASCRGLFLNLIKNTVSQVEDHGHAISIGFGGGFARNCELRRGASGHGHIPVTRSHGDSMSMDASFQHTKLGTLHEARYTAADSTRLGMRVRVRRYRRTRPCTEDER
jgi:hypothetical protein